ncbi:MAG: ribokinase [Gammaproteobacteria bacterium]|jgi:ribokinase
MSVPILVIGSSNTDMMVKARRLPKAGETVMGKSFLMNPGGKGANQAVTASRLGGSVKFISKVGNDIFGKQAIKQFEREKIDTSFIFTDTDSPSGVALINVDQNGENSIMVAPGANDNLSIEDVDKALDNIEAPYIVLLQLEIPLNTVEYAIEYCSSKKLQIILNPAPAVELNESILKSLSFITPNESEAELLTGIKITDIASAKKAAERIYLKGVPNVVITLGVRGAYIHNNEVSKLIPAPLVTAKDTTAAGDCFNGSLAVALSEGMPVEEAVSFACKSASIAVTRIGAQSSLPYRKEVNEIRLSVGIQSTSK